MVIQGNPKQQKAKSKIRFKKKTEIKGKIVLFLPPPSQSTRPPKPKYKPGKLEIF